MVERKNEIQILTGLGCMYIYNNVNNDNENTLKT